MSDPRTLPSKTNRPPLAVRVLGILLLTASVGLVSCQALFIL